MAGVTLRPAERADIDPIIELAARAMNYSQSPFRDTPLQDVQEFRRKDLTQLHSLFGQSQLGLFVAETNGKIIGHVIIVTGTLESVSGEEQRWIIDLTVL